MNNKLTVLENSQPLASVIYKQEFGNQKN